MVGRVKVWGWKRGVGVGVGSEYQEPKIDVKLLW